MIGEDMSILTILAIIASSISIVSTIWLVAFKLASFTQELASIKQNGCTRIQKEFENIQRLDKAVFKLEMQMQPFWSIIENQIAQSLHHSETPEYDRLLSKFSNSMSVTELDVLRVYLEDDLKDSLQKGDTGRLLSVSLVLSRVKARLHEGLEIRI